MKISLDLSREFAYDAEKVKEFKTKVRAPKGSGKGKKIFLSFFNGSLTLSLPRPVSIRILCTLFDAFPLVLTRRFCWTIKASLGGDHFLYSHDLNE